MRPSNPLIPALADAFYIDSTTYSPYRIVLDYIMYNLLMDADLALQQHKILINKIFYIHKLLFIFLMAPCYRGFLPLLPLWFLMTVCDQLGY